jgi:5'-3' exonuclease
MQVSIKLVKFLVYPVIEEDETSMEAADGTVVKVPVNMASPNPNNAEFDNLYLDMNGIVCDTYSCSTSLNSPTGTSLYSPRRKG